MPYQKSFRILLEEDNTDGSISDSKGVASFISLNGTDSGGTMNADSIVLGVDGTQAEGKPGWLSENAELALLYGSLLEAYTFMKGDPDLTSLYNSRFMEGLSRLKNLGEAQEVSDQYTSGEIRKAKT